MRKLLIVTASCLVLGLSGTAFAAGSHGGGGGHAGGDGGGGHAGGRGGAGGGDNLVLPPSGAGGAGGTGRPSVSMTQPGAALGSVTVDGTTITGTTQGVSGAVGGMAPVVRGQPAIPLLGTESDTTSQREACPAGDRQDYWGCINRRQ